MTRTKLALFLAGGALGATGAAVVPETLSGPPTVQVRHATLRPDDSGAVYLTDATCVIDGNPETAFQCAPREPIADPAVRVCAHSVLTYIRAGAVR